MSKRGVNRQARFRMVTTLIRIPFDRCPFAFMLRQAQHERATARDRLCSAHSEPVEGREAFALMDSPQSETVLVGCYGRAGVSESPAQRKSPARLEPSVKYVRFFSALDSVNPVGAIPFEGEATGQFFFIANDVRRSPQPVIRIDSLMLSLTPKERKHLLTANWTRVAAGPGREECGSVTACRLAEPPGRRKLTWGVSHAVTLPLGLPPPSHVQRRVGPLQHC